MAGNRNINHFLFTLFGFAKVKSRKHLAVIILVHASAWILFLVLPLLFYPMRLEGDPVWRRELIPKLCPIILFYVNYYLLLPKYFEKKKYLAYFAAVLLMITLTIANDIFLRTKLPGTFAFGINGTFTAARPAGLMTGPSNVVVFGVDSAHPDDGFFRDTLVHTLPQPPMAFAQRFIGGIPRPVIFFSINRTLSTCIFFLLLGGMIRLGYSFLRNQNEKKSLENANLNAEVNFLKSQINPHFLFNTLNSIYSQAHARSENTEFSILKLSELLRYVLYDSGERKVSLAQDVQYINNYIDLQRMRLSPKISVDYSVEGIMDDKTIAPLLLIGFIENAFKHGISYAHPSAIHIKIRIFEKTLTLLVTNPVLERDIFAPGGLGLKNVKRRLELLYPGQHQLNIFCRDDLYIVKLKLDLA